MFQLLVPTSPLAFGLRDGERCHCYSDQLPPGD